MSSSNENVARAAPHQTWAEKKAEILANVFALATQFSSCVEVFNLIHPSKESDREQRVALARLGIQQGRLLIFGDVVGISSPPATIAKHMVPSKPGATNPDPQLPIHFGVRDGRLDDPVINEKVKSALNEISGRPSHLSREELMEMYGLKSPRRMGLLEYPPLDTNRLEAFREKYSLLGDLLRASGTKPPRRRGTSMTTQQWAISNVDKFSDFLGLIRKEVDGLISLMGVREQVDRAMKLDIRSMGWHPDSNRLLLKHDFEKLKLIREACFRDYPEYVAVSETALKYIMQESKELGYSMRSTSLPELRERSSSDKRRDSGADAEESDGSNGKEKRPGILSFFKFKSWTKSSSKVPKISNSSETGVNQDRSMSLDLSGGSSAAAGQNAIDSVRSKSLSAVVDETAHMEMGSHLEKQPTYREHSIEIPKANPLEPVTTTNSLIERHDMYKGVGRVQTDEARAKAKDWAS